LVGPERGPKLTFQTLETLSAGEGRIVFGARVAAVLAYLQRGEVAAAIVYRTEVEGVK
jgi:ABC-type molybdate transport system substrate-binding protein